MRLLTSSFLVASAAIVVCACASERSGSDSRYTFNLQTASRACASDDDCAIVSNLGECSTCCSQGAVSREGERAYRAVVAACREPGAPGGYSCDMACAVPRAACFEGTCVAVPDPSVGAPNATCAVDGGAGDGGDGGAASAAAEPWTSCNAAPITTGFEEGLDPSWAISDPKLIAIDNAAPITGAASLRISYQQKETTLTIPQSGACGLRIAFTMRTNLIASGINLARIVVGDQAWFHVRLDGCSLSVAEEFRDGSAAGIGFGGVSWPVPANTPVRVVLAFDFAKQAMTSAVAPIGEPLPAPTSTFIRTTGTVRAVELGSTHGIVATGAGTVWIDDLSID